MVFENSSQIHINHTIIQTSYNGPQAYPKIVKAITSKKLKELFTPIQAIKICRPKNSGTFRKIFASYR